MIDDEIKHGLGVAFNEATLLGVEVDPRARRAAVTLAVLSLPEGDAPGPADNRISVRLENVGRVVASLRCGWWDDISAAVVPFPLKDLLEVVQRFKGQPIYGWEFIDTSQERMQSWLKRCSVDETVGSDGREHTLELFQEGPVDSKPCHLDICIWFQDISVVDPSGKPLSIADVIAGGKRWWDAMYAGDARTHGYGIVPGAPPSEPT